ncbi:MAG: response regulator [Flavisolibacter sp.]
MTTPLKYIFVDDDEFSNWIYSIVVKEVAGEVDITTFTVPGEAIEFIQTQYERIEGPTILFLDINMPMINGWEFLVHYAQFSEDVKSQISIYILSSSVDERDRNMAAVNKNVKGFISKPLTIEVVRSIIENRF